MAVRTRPLATDTATWETAQSANGPAVAAFLTTILYSREQALVFYGASFARRVNRWQNGEDAGFYSLDATLCAMGLLPIDLPEHVWQPWAAGNGPGSLTREGRVREAVAA